MKNEKFLKSIKVILNRFFPSSAREINARFENLEQKLAELYELVKYNNAEITGSISEITAALEAVKADLSKNIKLDDLQKNNSVITMQLKKWNDEYVFKMESLIHNHSNIILNGMRSVRKDYRTYYWNNPYEKRAIQNNYGTIIEEAGFMEMYLGLINGLDDESIKTINRILWRQNRYLSCDEEQLDLFTLEEQTELCKIEDIFEKEVIRISDDLYAYGRYLLPINHFEPVVFYYKYCLNEIDNLDSVKNTTIIDGGAFIGDTALIFSELEPKEIISFEPIKENAERCLETIRINGLKNVIVENKALGAHDGIINMHSAGEGSTCYPRKEDRDFYSAIEEVPIVTLDGYAKSKQLNIGLIKLDIEGSESDCLIGARDIIAEQHPIMLICIYHNRNDFFGIKTMIEKWNLNYRFKIRKPTVPNATYETILIAEPV